jgi:hypothetical protein
MTKLTLYMDNSLVSKAKKYARQNGTSVSKIVANFFKAMGRPYKLDESQLITPFVREISGILEDDGKSYKEIREEYYEHLAKKHK